MATYPSNSTTKRSATVKVMLHPDMLEKLRALAQHLGQAPATLASLAVSQFVAQQTAALGASDRAMNSLFESLTPDLRKMIESGSKAPTASAKGKKPKATQMRIEDAE